MNTVQWLYQLRHDRRMVFLNLWCYWTPNIPVWLSSCMWSSLEIFSVNKIIGQFVFGSQAWAGFIIVWAVQGIVSIPPSSAVFLKLLQWSYRCVSMPFIMARRDSSSSWWRFSSQRLVLCSGSWSQPTFSTMVRWLPLLRFSLSQVLISDTETFAEHFDITGYYYHDMELCIGYVIPAYNGDIWVPPFAFEAILALFAVWAGIRHSRQQSRSQSGFNKPRLVDSLVHGNVIYFVRYEFPYHC